MVEYKWRQKSKESEKVQLQPWQVLGLTKGQNFNFQLIFGLSLSSWFHWLNGLVSWVVWVYNTNWLLALFIWLEFVKVWQTSTSLEVTRTFLCLAKTARSWCSSPAFWFVPRSMTVTFFELKKRIIFRLFDGPNNLRGHKDIPAAQT